MKRTYYLLAVMAVCLIALLATCDASAQQPTPNDAIQDKAVVVDQTRQDKADAKQDVKIEAALDQTEANAVNKADNVAQDELAAVNTAKIEAIEDQALSDREFMGVMILVVIGVLFAVWVMQHRSAARIHAAADLLVDRTEMLEAHIAETTPWVKQAYEKNRPHKEA